MSTESPRERVASLLHEELETVRDSVRGNRARQSLKSLAERASAEDLVRDQYAGRYPFELIQNANDAGADGRTSGGTVAFTLTDTALLVADQGTGFGIDQVEAICGFANSSKDPRKSIGYKGLGFKSVKEITSAPQIFAPDVQFGFDGLRAQQLVREALGAAGDLPAVPYYAFPFPITPDDAGDDRNIVVDALSAGFRTVIRLPFRDDVSREAVDQTLRDTLHPRVLLFLDHLDRLTVAGTSADFVATVARGDDGDCTEVLLDLDGQVEHFLVFGAKRSIPDHKLVADLGGAWEKVDAVRLFAAVPLAEDGLPDTGGSESLHVYFPTEEDSGLSLVLNADFQLDAARLRIANVPNTVGYNGWLIDELAGFVANTVIPALLSRFANHPRVTAAVLYPEPTGMWPKRLRQRLVQLLAESPFITCADGSARRADELNMLPWSVPDVAFFQTLLPDDIERLVHADLDANGTEHEILRDDFAVPELDGEEMFANLNSPAAEMVTRYYEALVEWWTAAPSWESEWLAEARCVQLEGGGWATPGDAFLPPQRGEHHLPAGVPVPIASLPDVPDAEPMLRRVGLQTFGWRPVIVDYLVPILTNPDATTAERANALDLLRNYHGSDGHDTVVRKEVGAVLLHGATSDGDESVLVPARWLYFTDDQVPESGLSALYGPFKHPEFLAEPLPDDPELLDDEITFFSWLGVEDKPRIHDRRGGESKSPSPDYTAPPWQSNSAWMRTSGYQSAEACGQGHPRSQLLRSSPWIDRLDEIIDEQDFAQLSTLWNVFARKWDHYEEAMHAEFSCGATAHRGTTRRRFPSLVAHVLASSPWVPSLQNGEQWLQVPDSLWHLPDDTPAAIAKFLPVLAPHLVSKRPMCDALGVIDGKRPGARNLIEILRQLNSEADEASGRVTASARNVARWAMRKLDRVAQDISSDDTADIPLLARLDGAPVFAPRPYLTSDRLAEEAWQEILPIYDGDRTARNLLERLDLPVLEEQLIVAPHAIGSDPFVESRTVGTFETVMPQLLAAAAQLAPSLQVEISRKLNGLKICCVQHLSLRYQLDDEIRIAPAPTSYIKRDGEYRGTAYLAVDREAGAIDWYTFAAQLASHIDIEDASDRFAILLTNPRGREQYLAARGIADADIVAAQQLLADNPAPDEAVADGDEPASATVAFASEVPPPESDPDSAPGEDPRDALSVAVSIEGATSQSGVPSSDSTSPEMPAYDRASQDAGNKFAEVQEHESRRGGGAPVNGKTTWSSDGEGDDEVSPSAQTPAGKYRNRSTTSTADHRVGAVDDQSPQGRFFSYVVPRESPALDTADPGESISLEVDRAGVARVLDYERCAGRDPREQPHNNPGFDVASHNPDGSVARYIEIKSLSGRWAERGVAMSRRQAAENVDRGQEFWLYVVEYAMDDSRAQVFPIHDPISKAGWFVFDGGWSAYSEPDNHDATS